MIPTIPLDATARNGRYQLVSDGRTWASARWHDGAWVYASGRAVEFVPVGYRA